MPNMNLIFKLRKKVMELRDLVALQEVEIVNITNTVQYIKIRDLMIEIDALRALVDEKGGSGIDMTAQNEIESLRKQLTEARANNKSTGDFSRSRHESIVAELRAEIDRLRSSSGDQSKETAEFQRTITELRIQLDAKTQESDQTRAELQKLRQ